MPVSAHVSPLVRDHLYDLAAEMSGGGLNAADLVREAVAAYVLTVVASTAANRGYITSPAGFAMLVIRAQTTDDVSPSVRVELEFIAEQLLTKTAHTVTAEQLAWIAVGLEDRNGGA